MASASSDISEEMIKSLFIECFQIMMFLRYFFVTTSSLFSSLFCFVLFKVQSKIGVRIIHGRALYTGKYSSPTNNKAVKNKMMTTTTITIKVTIIMIIISSRGNTKHL